MDRASPDIEVDELERRQQLAMARRQRESERKALVAEFVDIRVHADRLRNWISGYQRSDKSANYPELQRMLEWAEAELTELNAFLDPGLLSATLRDRDLFPEVDPLRDPFGDPPRHRVWGGCTALRTGDMGQPYSDSLLQFDRHGESGCRPP